MTTPRIFDFTPSFEVPLPAVLPTPTRVTNALPFKAQFDKHEQAALGNKAPHFFIPLAYFLSRPNVNAKNVTHSWVKAKLRAEFNDWQGATATVPAVKGPGGKVLKPAVNEQRGDVLVVMIDRTGGEEGFGEPGVSLWLTLTDAGKVKAAERAQAAAEEAAKEAAKAAKEAEKAAKKLQPA